jgi:hypothetical protein
MTDAAELEDMGKYMLISLFLPNISVILSHAM